MIKAHFGQLLHTWLHWTEGKIIVTSADQSSKTYIECGP